MLRETNNTNEINIFICFTPLHVLISQKIILSEKIKNVFLIYFSESDNNKNIYYSNKLNSYCDSRKYILLKKSFRKDIWSLISLYRSMNNNLHSKDLNFYCGNIKSSYSRLIIYLLGYNKIMTFDDGSGNLNKGGYFWDPNERWLFKYFFQLFDKSLLYQNITKSISKHYTIYKLTNVYPNTEYLEFFEGVENKTTKKPISILLTSPFSEDKLIKEEDALSLFNQVIKRFNIDFVIRHPRETQKKLTKVIELEGDLIAEEHILKLNKEFDVTVYGVYSTALINIKLMGLQNVLCVESSLLPFDKSKLFEEFNIKLISLD